jgi:hypothetical protein
MTEAVVAEPLLVPAMFRKREVHIVGLGALGSAIFQNLFRALATDTSGLVIVLWDHDVVEPRNRFNQRVFEADINFRKVSSQARIAKMIHATSGVTLQLHDAKVTHETIFDKPGIVIAAVDSMAARAIIWDRVKRNSNVEFFSDGRVGMDGGKAYGLDPNNEVHIARYEDPIHTHADPQVIAPACKTEFPIPSTCDIVAGHVFWRMVRWFHLECGSEDPYDNFVGVCFIPSLVHVTEQWDKSADDETPDVNMAE